MDCCPPPDFAKVRGAGGRSTGDMVASVQRICCTICGTTLGQVVCLSGADLGSVCDGCREASREKLARLVAQL